jgi:hypothetical protein
MDWQPISTAPRRTRLLISDERRHVQVARAAGLRWYDDASSLLSGRPQWWQPLPEAPADAAEPKRTKPARKDRTR